MNNHIDKQSTPKMFFFFILELLTLFVLPKVIPCKILAYDLMIIPIILFPISLAVKNITGKRILKALMLFLMGGSIYVLIELLFRGYSHWSMYILGGLCFILIGVLNEILNMSIVSQMVVSAGIITGLELLVGVIVNKVFLLNVWDYSNLPYNFCGQICLLFANLWFLLSFVGIILDDFIRHILYGEEFPKYYL